MRTITIRIILLGIIILKVRGQVKQRFNCHDGCCDQHEWCPFWATIGECSSNSDWMPENCQFACNTCPNTGGKPAPTPQPSPAADPAPAPAPVQTPPTPATAPTTTETTTTTTSTTSTSTATTETAATPATPATAATAATPASSTTSQSASSTSAPSPGPASGPRQSQGNNPSKCEEIKQSKDAINAMIKEGLVADKEDISFRREPTLGEMAGAGSQFGCGGPLDSLDCSRNLCYHLRYRTLDGSCNNFQNPNFGAAGSPYLRLKSATYDDGLSAPVASTKGGRPSARDLSRQLLSSSATVTNNAINSLALEFGQLIVHDVTKTLLMGSSQCSGCTEVPGACFPIKSQPSDPHCNGQSCCQSFTRAAPVCGSGSSAPRAQLNVVTSYLDASPVYGMSTVDSDRLRDGALLKTTMFNGHPMLPFNQAGCSSVDSCTSSFDSGDDRLAIFVGLASLQVLFMREHNRVATSLQQKNPSWSPDRVFQEARKIVGAEMQAVTYKEWLPKMLGNSFGSIVGTYKGYNPQTNPSIANEFAHAAMRFGHGMIPESFNKASDGGSVVGTLSFVDGVLKPQRMLFEGGIDTFIWGMITMPLKRPQRVTTSVTEKMFGSTDLAATNIQRGRDVGLASYNEYREFCGLKRASSFDDFSSEMLDSGVRNSLKQVYGSPDNVDLYVGGMLEDPVSGGMVGPTFACIVGNQFTKLREGDRLWFQNPAVFTAAQLAELEHVSMARILCDNLDSTQSVPSDAFAMGSSSVSCSSVPTVDLGKWTE